MMIQYISFYHFIVLKSSRNKVICQTLTNINVVAQDCACKIVIITYSVAHICAAIISLVVIVFMY